MHSEIYSVYRQLHPPTGIEHCLYCNFFSSTEKNLVVSGVNLLQVFRLNFDQDNKSNDKGTESRTRKEKLECLAQFQLFGNIMSMDKVRLTGNTRDTLLLSFKDAKLSLVDYDPGTHDLKTSSLHYFEEEEMKSGCTQQTSNIPLVRVDPEGRCAAMLIYGTRLVILPFRRDTGGEDPENPLGTGKSPVLSSYTINLTTMDEKITNVIDVQFLHGYYEPTVFILFEPLPTWAGRVAVRRDSCTIVAISLNLRQKVHPVIWSLSGLPFDSFKVLPVDRPIGGVLVFDSNSLIYLNQSVPPYGVSLNSLSDFSTEFLLKHQDGVRISLDCAQASFIGEDRLVMSLKGGELYVVTLLIDGMRSVRGFNFDKAAASVLTTCMCQCEDGYLFLGSRLGNSLLLKYTEKATEGAASVESAATTSKKADEPPTKKKKTEFMGDWMASDVSKLDDLDELEVYGSEAQTGTTITLYTFEVCDSILNIGPCGFTVMGEPAFLSEEFGNLVDPDIELVSTSGYSKNGALSVLQRTIRPQVVTTFELPGCRDMWTVVGPEKKKLKDEQDDDDDVIITDGDDENQSEDVEGGHALLILSRDDSSMVLETGQEINELDHSGFSTQSTTVYAGNIGENKFIIQVSSMGIRLLEGVNQIQHIPIDVGSAIVCCSVADPHVLIMSEEGVVMLLTFRSDGDHGPRLTVSRPMLPQASRILTMAAYCDISGMFTTAQMNTEPESTLPTPEVKMPSLDPLDSTKATVDDEDELLYGSSDMTNLFGAPHDDKKEEEPQPKQPETQRKEFKPTYWCIFARDNGVLEMYSLPDFKLVFHVKNFPVGHKVLVDSGAQTNLNEQAGKSGASEKVTAELLPVRELLLVGLGHRRSRPHLFARVEEELVIYEAFPYHQTGSLDNHLKLRFKKIPHGLILKEKKSKKSKDTEENGKEQQNCVRWLRPFDNISGYSGVFICGPYPHWLFMSQRGTLRFHPMGIDGMVTCFSPFHNINCPRGFLYFNRHGELRISVLPTHLSYDAPWPIRKVPLRCTPHFVQYHQESKTYSVVTSTGELCNRMLRLQGEGEKEFDILERDERFIYPQVEKFSVQLFSPLSWEAIPNTKFDMEDFEHVTSMKIVYLKSEGTVTGLKGFVALGTNYNYTEDVTSRGRIMIYDVIEVVPEPGQPLTKNKIKVVYDKEQKGPVTALDHVQGFLVSAIGQKIYIWQLKDGDLSGVAFIDTQIYIHSITTIKNMILVSDILHSIALLRYQVDMKVLSLVSRDVKPLEVYTAGFLVDNTTLSFLVSDRNKNLIVYMYQPEVRESHGGMRLLRRADINVGSHVNSFFRMRCKLTDPSTDKKAVGILEKRHITYFSTLDGSLSFLLPISEKTYRRLFTLQNFLTTNIPHHAGLNPRAYRLLHAETKLLNNSMKNIVDGDLLYRYLHLSLTERDEITRRMGTTPEQIMDDLMDIDRQTAHY